MKILLHAVAAFGAVVVACTAQGQTRHKEFYEDGKTLRREYSTLKDGTTLHGEDKYFRANKEPESTFTYDRGVLTHLKSFLPGGAIWFNVGFALNEAGERVQIGEVSLYRQNQLYLFGLLNSDGEYSLFNTYREPGQPLFVYNDELQRDNFVLFNEMGDTSIHAIVRDGRMDLFDSEKGRIENNQIENYRTNLILNGDLAVHGGRSNIMIYEGDEDFNKVTMTHYTRQPFQQKVSMFVSSKELAVRGVRFRYPDRVVLMLDGKEVELKDEQAELFEPYIEVNKKTRRGELDRIAGNMLVEKEYYEDNKLIWSQRYDTTGVITAEFVEPGYEATERPKQAPYILFAKMPTFLGGDLAVFRDWVLSRLRYPKEALDKEIQGRVVLSFVIEKDGTLGYITVVQSPHPSLAKEAIRVLRSSPAWNPGIQRDKEVRVKYNLPVDFRLQR